MKNITVPQPLELTFATKDAEGNQATEQRSLTFQNFVEHNVLNQVVFGFSLESLELREEILSALANQETVSLSDAAHALLNGALNDRKQVCGEGWVPESGHQILPFMRAVRDAATVNESGAV